MNSKRLLIAAAVCGLTLLTQRSLADTVKPDTLKLVSLGSEKVGGVSVYPYNFSIDGSAKTTALMCMDFNRNITLNEQWNVSISGLSMLSTTSAIQYRAEAYLFSLLGGSIDAGAIQYAAWEIFDPAVVRTSGWKSSDMALVNDAFAAAIDQKLMNSGFFSTFRIYAPLTDSTSRKSWTAGEPQEFIGRVAATPEPSSMMLLGTGLLASGFMLRRRKGGSEAVMTQS